MCCWTVSVYSVDAVLIINEYWSTAAAAVGWSADAELLMVMLQAEASISVQCSVGGQASLGCCNWEGQGHAIQTVITLSSSPTEDLMNYTWFHHELLSAVQVSALTLYIILWHIKRWNCFICGSYSKWMSRSCLHTEPECRFASAAASLTPMISADWGYRYRDAVYESCRLIYIFHVDATKLKMHLYKMDNI